MSEWSTKRDRKQMDRAVTSLAVDGAVTLDLTGLTQLTMIPGSGSTISYSYVDSATASGHDTATTATTGTTKTISVVWPFVRVSTAGGTARVAAV